MDTQPPPASESLPEKVPGKARRPGILGAAAVLSPVLAAALGPSAVGAAGFRVRVETALADFGRELSGPGEVALEPGPGGRVQLRLGAEAFPLDEILHLEIAGALDEPQPWILFLRAGGEIAGAAAGGDGESVSWRSPSLGSEPVRIALDDVLGLLAVRKPGEGTGTSADALREAALALRLREEILKRLSPADEVVLPEGGRIQGVLDSVNATGIRFSAQALGTVDLPWARIRALSLAALSETPPGGAGGSEGSGEKAASGGSSRRVRVRFRDGTLLPAELSSLEGGKVSLRHPTLGLRSTALSDVIEVDFLGGRAVYLSDLEPASAREECGPLFRLRMPHRRDASVVGTPLRMRGKAYRKGLGVHAYSRLEYDLGGAYEKFRATVGLDDTARPESGDPNVGRVVFRAYRDGEKIFERELTWKDDPVPIDLSVRGAKRLALEADYGGSGGSLDLALDRANWAEARLVR